MLTLAAIGGFFVPVAFGHLVPHTTFDTGWVFLAIASFAFALLGLAGRNPTTGSTQGSEVTAPRHQIPRLFNNRVHHVEPACHRELVRGAECQLSTSSLY
jgi:hypothetical protein